MAKIKIFVLDSKSEARYYRMGINNAALQLGMKIGSDIELQIREEDVDRIPRDYDIYIIHFSNAKLEDIKALRREQPWSIIAGISGGGVLRQDPELIESIDAWHWVMGVRECKNLIQRAIEKMETKPKKSKSY